MSICWTHPERSARITVVGSAGGGGIASSVIASGLGEGPFGTDLIGGLSADPLEDLADVHGVRAVVDERDDGEDRGDAEHDRDCDGDVGDHGVAAGVERGSDRAEHDDAVGEGSDDERHHTLVERVAEQGVDDAWRVLARGELDDQQRHRERDPGEGDRGAGDHAEQGAGALDGRGEPERQVGERRVDVTIDGQAGERRARRRRSPRASARRTGWSAAVRRASSIRRFIAPSRCCLGHPGGDCRPE